jgi:hypothetical protein
MKKNRRNWAGHCAHARHYWLNISQGKQQEVILEGDEATYQRI